MKTIDLEVTMPEDRVLTVQLPPTVEPGDEIRVLLVNSEGDRMPRRSLNLPLDNVGPWPEDLSLRREEMYGDDGR